MLREGRSALPAECFPGETLHQRALPSPFPSMMQCVSPGKHPRTRGLRQAQAERDRGSGTRYSRHVRRGPLPNSAYPEPVEGCPAQPYDRSVSPGKRSAAEFSVAKHVEARFSEVKHARLTGLPRCHVGRLPEANRLSSAHPELVEGCIAQRLESGVSPGKHADAKFSEAKHGKAKFRVAEQGARLTNLRQAQPGPVEGPCHKNVSPGKHP
jgi:hypothetical protein